jgi:hypothetical protein
VFMTPYCLIPERRLNSMLTKVKLSVQTTLHDRIRTCKRMSSCVLPHFLLSVHPSASHDLEPNCMTLLNTYNHSTTY